MLDTLGTQSMIVIYLKECINEFVIFRDKNDTQFAYVSQSRVAGRARALRAFILKHVIAREQDGRKEGKANRAAQVRDSGWHGSRHLCNGPRIVSCLGSGRCPVSPESEPDQWYHGTKSPET